MPYQNLSAVLSPADRILILKKLDEAGDLMPFVVNLTKAEKKKSFRLGKKTERFLFDVQKIVENNPAFVPNYINTAEMDKDFELHSRLLPVELKLRQLLEAVSDTRYALAQECQKASLVIYKNIQAAATTNTPGADTALATLSPYFKKTKKKK